MTLFWKAAAAVLLTLILVLALGKQEKDIGIILTTAVCCMVTVAGISYLEPVLDFLWQLQAMGDLQEDVLKTLLKIFGIGMVSQITAAVCADAGNASLGKTMELLGAAVILYLSLPLFTTFMELIQRIIGEL